ncbi:hypothetical protein C8E17_3230 [Serratia plymuthica]|nr:hypothetical protein C8E17_3230 [Serratia plymuthica]
MFTDLSLECRALKDVIEKNFKTSDKRELVSCMVTQFTMSIRQACRKLSLSRTVFLYQPDNREVLAPER